MNTFGLGLGAAARHDLDPSSFAPGTAAAELAHKLAPLIEAERQARRDDEREGYSRNPDAPRLAGGLLSLAPGDAYFAADITPWHEMLADVGFLARCAQAVGAHTGPLAQSIVDHLMPPNWQVFFWMARALESVPLDMAQQWSNEVAAVARQEAEQAAKLKATSNGKLKADARWAQAREQRAWWEREWAQARAGNSKLGKKAFVRHHWLAYLALSPKPRYTEDTVATKWLRGK